MKLVKIHAELKKFSTSRSATTAILLVGLSLPLQVQAQTLNKASLFTGRAAAKAESARKRVRARNSRVTFSDSNREPTLAHDLQLDTVDDFIGSKGGSVYRDYKAFAYLRYLNDVVNLDELDPIVETSFTEKLLVYHSLTTFSEFIKSTPLQGYYRKTARSLKRIGRKTTLELVRSSDGSVGVQQGSDHSSKLLEFRLHASARNGIEPRLRFSEHLMLRYEFLEQNAILEFNYDF